MRDRNFLTIICSIFERILPCRLQQLLFATLFVMQFITLECVSMHFLLLLFVACFNYLKYTKCYLIFYYEIIISLPPLWWQNIINFNLFSSLMTNFLLFLKSADNLFHYDSNIWWNPLIMERIPSFSFFSLLSFHLTTLTFKKNLILTRDSLNYTLQWCFLINDLILRWYMSSMITLSWFLFLVLGKFFITSSCWCWMKYDFFSPL